MDSGLCILFTPLQDDAPEVLDLSDSALSDGKLNTLEKMRRTPPVVVLSKD